jgi:ABC-type antimicrobial peptide transport system ATPase subunit
MDEGVIVEQGPPDEVLVRPTHERTRRFLRMVDQQSVDGPEENSDAY